MQPRTFLKAYVELLRRLPLLPTVETRLEEVAGLLRSLPGVLEAAVLDLRDPRAAAPRDASCLDRLSGEPCELFENADALPWREGATLLRPVRSADGRTLGAVALRVEPGRSHDDALELELVGDRVREVLESASRDEGRSGIGEPLSRGGGGPEAGAGPVGLEALLDGLPIPFYVAEESGRFLHANRVFLQLAGYQRVEQLNGAPGLFPQARYRQEELEYICRHGSISNFTLAVRRGDGQELIVRDSALLLDGTVYGVVFDLTEHMILNRELQEALEMQEFLNDRIIESASALRATQTATIRALARLAEYRDAETGNHLQRICEYSRLIASEIRRRNPYSFTIGQDYVADIHISSMLHDIGKVGVPDSILLKPGPLDAGEWEVMKNHTVWGWAILNRADRELGEQSFLTLASTLALHHHERYDGTGYPHGLAGEKIPLSARIVALADVYDALVNLRPYKEPWRHERVREEIVSQRGRQFDPAITDIFLSVEQEFLAISRRFPD